MNREDVISMAREAGLLVNPLLENYAVLVDGFPVEVERFAALVAAAEREACAKGCDEAALGFGEETEWAQGYAQGIRDAADGIRARNQP